MKGMPFWLALSLALLLGIAGQLSLKWGVRTGGKLEGLDMRLLQTLFTPWVLLGLALYAISSLFWLISLSRADLSYVYPFVSLNFAFIVLFSHFLFGDPIGALRLLGVFFICLGVILVSFS